jgi:ABC-type uncharacterized transport system substrate-binding protein
VPPANQFKNPELAAKRLTLLQELIPGLSMVACLRNPDNPALDVELTELRTAAQDLRLQLQVYDMRTEADIESVFGAASSTGARIILVPNDALANLYLTIVELAQHLRLPLMADTRPSWMPAP